MRLLFLLLALLPQIALAKTAEEKLSRIDHIVVIFLENHSFDNLFGTFPGADGIANAKDKAIQRDVNNKAYSTLPAVEKEKRFPTDLSNKPFLITDYVGADETIPDPIHRFYQTIYQINGGKMDRFVAGSNVGGLVMGYYEQKHSPLWEYAKNYTLADRFFVSVFGGSLINHLYLICACIPHYENAPTDMHTVLDKKGMVVKDGPLTPDGYAVNSIQPFAEPTKEKDLAHRLPAQTFPTIGDRLSEADISWGWYGGGWNRANMGRMEKGFQPHHQPFLYFKNFAPDTQAREEHLKDYDDLINAIDTNALPAVSFYKPIGELDLHPGYTSMVEGENHAFDLVKRIEKSAAWKNTLIIVTFDDSGGFWDHVAPPKGDRFGPGVRVPALLISPLVKKGFVDHTTYDFTAILKLIETRHGLKPLNARDAKAKPFTNAFQ